MSINLAARQPCLACNSQHSVPGQQPLCPLLKMSCGSAMSRHPHLLQSLPEPFKELCDQECTQHPGPPSKCVSAQEGQENHTPKGHAEKASQVQTPSDLWMLTVVCCAEEGLHQIGQARDVIQAQQQG